MSNTYAAGEHGIAIYTQSSTTFAVTDFSAIVAMGNKVSHDYTLDPDKQTRNYQRFSAWEAQAVRMGGRVARLTIRADMDTVDYPKLLRAHAGTPVTVSNVDTYTMGGTAGSARNKLSIMVNNGKTDGVTGTSMGVLFDKLLSCRVMSLHTMEEDGAGPAQYEAEIMGIYAGEQSVPLSGISFTAGVLFVKGGTVVTVDPGGSSYSPLLLTWGVTSVNGGDPLFTTVTANQANVNGATDPTGFDNGPLGATFDALLRASEHNGSVYDDFQANTARAWTITLYSQDWSGTGSMQIDITMPAVQILTGPIDPQTSQRMTLNAVVLAGMSYVVTTHA